MSRFDTIIRSGTVVTASEVIEADVGIKDGRILDLGVKLSGADRLIDAGGRLVLPVGIDSHVHIDEPPFYGVQGVDDFLSGTVSAACGGNTTMISFAQQVRGRSLQSAFEEYSAKARDKAVIDYAFHMILCDTNDEMLSTEFPAIVEQGVTSFKLYMRYEGLALDDSQVLAAMEKARECGAMILVHAENDHCIHFIQNRLEREGKTALRHFSESAPQPVEREATHRTIALAEIADTPVLLVHVSAQQAMEQIKWAQDRAMPVFGETCPQYLFIAAEDFDKPGWEPAKFLCTPPPREGSNQAHIWRGIQTGVFQVLSSDHCAFRFESSEGKKVVDEPHISKVPPGVPGIELRLPLVFSEGVNKGRIDLNRFVQIASTNAAKIYGLYPKKGSITPGADADIAIWDPELTRTVTLDMLHDNMDFSPYEGMTLTGWPIRTISRGETVWSDGKVTAEPGRGRYLRRRAGGNRMGPARAGNDRDLNSAA
jgi:dihydropyrimidinase